MRSGTIYQRRPLAPLTGATGSGLLPTPMSRDWKDSASAGNRKSPGLGVVAHWPTPTAWLGRREAHAKGDGARYLDPARSNELSDAVDASGTSGSLSPTWVEWLQGFPLGWTEVE